VGGARLMAEAPAVQSVREHPEADEGLRALGIHRIAVPIPFADAGAPVNAYAIENGDGTLTLFDTGLGTPEAEGSLRASAAAAGLDLGKVSRVIVSHGHIDHYGLAQTFAEVNDAPVHLHAADYDKVVGGERWAARPERYSSYFIRLGVPADIVEKMVKLAGSHERFARRVDEARVRAATPGERFSFGRFEGQLVHMPGHTPGLMCLWVEEFRLFFSDDHLLARISPNPLIELGEGGDEQKFLALPTYLKSAKRAYEMDIDLVLPGHGPPFRGHRPLLDGLFHFYDVRQERLCARLAVSDASAVEMVRSLFGRADPMRLFLTLSEVIGNLEVLEAKGRVSRKLVDGTYRFALAPAATGG
jgi:glyoxylase-like metal-dependent hydrolase (beta-lactamase superfamily II)